MTTRSSDSNPELASKTDQKSSSLGVCDSHLFEILNGALYYEQWDIGTTRLVQGSSLSNVFN